MWSISSIYSIYICGQPSLTNTFTHQKHILVLKTPAIIEPIGFFENIYLLRKIYISLRRLLPNAVTSSLLYSYPYQQSFRRSGQLQNSGGKFRTSASQQAHLVSFGDHRVPHSLKHWVFRLVTLTSEAPEHFQFHYVECESRWVTPAVVVTQHSFLSSANKTMAVAGGGGPLRLCMIGPMRICISARVSRITCRAAVCDSATRQRAN